MNHTQNILIVDDTPENLIILERVLRRVPANIIRASSGQEALVAALNNNLALAILDVQMPEMDGYELATLLREHDDFRTLPIIFVSAVYSDEQHVFKGYEAGAVDFMVKPFDSAQLLSKVKVFLDLNRANLELQKKVEELALSESRFQTLVRTIPDIVFRVDPEGNVVFINSAVQFLGYTPEELLNTSLTTIVHEEDWKELRDNLLEKEKNETAHTGILHAELRLLSKPHFSDENIPEESGATSEGRRIVQAELTSSQILQTHPDSVRRRILGTVGVIRDITERKEAEKELTLYREHLEHLVEERTSKLQEEMEERKKSEEKRQQLESMLMQQQRLESIGTLAGGVAHEINNPINGIMNYAQLIMDEDASESTSEFSKAIIEETNRVSKIVRNLLQFARADQGVGMEKADPQEMVDYVVSLVKTIIRHDQIQLIIDEPTEPIPSVICRKNEIEQVIMNLFTNACDALNTRYEGYDENKLVRVTLANGMLKDRPSVQFIVEDHGMGIEEEVLSHIFEPFYTTKDRSTGTGLGLSISHGIVKDHEGELRVVSQEKVFTRFTLEIPVSSE